MGYQSTGEIDVEEGCKEALAGGRNLTDGSSERSLSRENLGPFLPQFRGTLGQKGNSLQILWSTLEICLRCS
jgi:hypothetical protein